MRDEIYYDYYMGDRPEKKKTNERLWTVLIASFVAAFGPFSFGYGMGYSSAAVTQLENVNATDLHLDKDGITWFGVRCFTLAFTSVYLVYFKRGMRRFHSSLELLSFALAASREQTLTSSISECFFCL